jgi:uncharacterized protein (UPF0264 family)
LLVSVRSAAEAETALAGGADLIDVKEPTLGSLGRASEETIGGVVAAVARRRPVSAALGEFRAAPVAGGELPMHINSLSYVKWGLSGLGNSPSWRFALAAYSQRLCRIATTCRLVAVAYADWKRAEAPPPTEVAECAAEMSAGAFLLDTWFKDGGTLLDWQSETELASLCNLCKRAHIPIALAGSVGPAEIARLRALQPEWFAVRGAVCRNNKREAEIDPVKVCQLALLIQTGSHLVANSAS